MNASPCVVIVMSGYCTKNETRSQSCGGDTGFCSIIDFASSTSLSSDPSVPGLTTPHHRSGKSTTALSTDDGKTGVEMLRHPAPSFCSPDRHLFALSDN